MLMKFKYEKEFREAHPETIGEKDSTFDLCNYTEWLETIVSRVELPVKVKQKIADTVKDIMQEGFEIAMGGNIDLSEEANRREQTARYDRAVKNYTEIIARNFSA